MYRVFMIEFLMEKSDGVYIFLNKNHEIVILIIWDKLLIVFHVYYYVLLSFFHIKNVYWSMNLVYCVNIGEEWTVQMWKSKVLFMNNCIPCMKVPPPPPPPPVLIFVKTPKVFIEMTPYFSNVVVRSSCLNFGRTFYYLRGHQIVKIVRSRFWVN